MAATDKATASRMPRGSAAFFLPAKFSSAACVRSHSVSRISSKLLSLNIAWGGMLQASAFESWPRQKVDGGPENDWNRAGKRQKFRRWTVATCSSMRAWRGVMGRRAIARPRSVSRPLRASRAPSASRHAAAAWKYHHHSIASVAVKSHT